LRIWQIYFTHIRIMRILHILQEILHNIKDITSYCEAILRLFLSRLCFLESQLL